jgi:hypothetical protein
MQQGMENTFYRVFVGGETVQEKTAHTAGPTSGTLSFAHWSFSTIQGAAETRRAYCRRCELTHPLAMQQGMENTFYRVFVGGETVPGHRRQ